MEIKESIIFHLSMPSGEYFCHSMAAVYYWLRQFYPEFVRSKKIRLGKKAVGDVREISLENGKKIILRVLPSYKMMGRQKSQ